MGRGRGLEGGSSWGSAAGRQPSRESIARSIVAGTPPPPPANRLQAPLSTLTALFEVCSLYCVWIKLWFTGSLPSLLNMNAEWRGNMRVFEVFTEVLRLKLKPLLPWRWRQQVTCDKIWYTKEVMIAEHMLGNIWNYFTNILPRWEV